MPESTLLKIEGLRFTYPRRTAPALAGVDLSIAAGSMMILTGPSGCAKSTLARYLAGLLGSDPGHGVPVQYVWQEPGMSLNPRFTALEAVAEPLTIRGDRDAWERALEAIALVGMEPASAGKSTSEFSGGQRARLAVARAVVAMNGRRGLLILDESLASLDPGTQVRMIELLRRLQAQLDLALMIVSHDIGLLTDAGTLAVMEGGRIVECGPAAQLLASPQHSVTTRLVELLRMGDAA